MVKVRKSTPTRLCFPDAGISLAEQVSATLTTRPCHSELVLEAVSCVVSCWNKFRGQQDTEAELDAEEVFFSPSTAAGAFTALKLPVAAKP